MLQCGNQPFVKNDVSILSGHSWSDVLLVSNRNNDHNWSITFVSPSLFSTAFASTRFGTQRESLETQGPTLCFFALMT